MDRSHDVGSCGETAGPALTARHDPRPLDLDLDRLVWDPEYRARMRQLLGQER